MTKPIYRIKYWSEITNDWAFTCLMTLENAKFILATFDKAEIIKDEGEA